MNGRTPSGKSALVGPIEDLLRFRDRFRTPLHWVIFKVPVGSKKRISSMHQPDSSVWQKVTIYLWHSLDRNKKNHEWIHECPSSNTGFCLQNFNHDKVLDLLDIELLIRFCWWHADKTLPYLIYQFTPKTTRRKVTKIRCLGNLVVDGMGMCCLDLDVPFYHFYQRSFARHQPAELAGMAREYSVYAARWIAKLVNPPGCWRDGEHDTMGWLRDDRTMFFSIRRMKGWSLLACKRNV